MTETTNEVLLLVQQCHFYFLKPLIVIFSRQLIDINCHGVNLHCLFGLLRLLHNELFTVCFPLSMPCVYQQGLWSEMLIVVSLLFQVSDFIAMELVDKMR